ncbi:MAG TPA: DUF3750 domain-containing protein [Candidatus Omnitrophota bacterium]|nr:DUF3750 domain-containing protein [Candidatus Omnitrophota bacterium]
MTKWMLLLALVAFIGPLVANAVAGAGRSPLPWYSAPMDAVGLAPDPSRVREAVVQVYAAPAFSWRGIVATHTWIVVKRQGAERLTRYDVVGWGGGDRVKVDWAPPDGLWYGKRPMLLLDRRGPEVEALIDGVEAAVRDYPWRHTYRTWPGPNSNTFTAHVAREVPGLRLDLPANALGKDFVPVSRMLTRAPSGTGVQVSLAGILGVMVAAEEGVEVNVLGLSLGLDVLQPAIRLPGIGRFPR